MLVNRRDFAYTKLKIKHEQKEKLVRLLNCGLDYIATMGDLEQEDKDTLAFGRKLVSDLGYKAR